MKKHSIISISLLPLILATIYGLTSCNSDDDIAVNDKNIIGTWICYEQEIYDCGDEWTEYYDNDKNTFTFNSDYTGEVTCYDGSLFEIGSDCSFIWELQDNKIATTIYGDAYTIISLSKTKMTLFWEDEDLRMTCRFKKKEEEIIDNSEGTLTSENLVGRWACISYYDMESTHNFSLTEDDLATGHFYLYIDFRSNGSGYKETMVTSNMILGSSSTPFNWNYANNKFNIQIGTGGYEETWKVNSFKGGVLTLSRDKFTASFKKSAVKVD